MQRKSAVRNGFAKGQRGVTVPEVIVVLVLVCVVSLFLLMALPRQRETARYAGCQKNLKQIGVALALYDQAAGHLPLVPDLTVADTSRAASPLKALLEKLAIPDLTELSDAKNPPPRQAGLSVAERPLPGFICASDPNATAGLFPAPISYRATTGDAPDGRNGAFAPGRRVTLAEIEASDGSSYTAAFAERLVGDNRANTPSPVNYANMPGPWNQGGCPEAPDSAWRGDAGSSWIASSWRTTLYNHALLPNAFPSCLTEDGRSAYLGASSGHLQGVNVLFCDGSVRTITPQVDAKIWRDWATFTNRPTVEHPSPRKCVPRA